MYFKFPELIKTDCGISNIPYEMTHVENLVVLSDFLNQIRHEFGEPIYVNSAYRNKEVNRRVGGVPNSLHLVGRAADIRPCYVPACDFDTNFQRLIDVIKSHRDELAEFIPHSTYIHIAI